MWQTRASGCFLVLLLITTHTHAQSSNFEQLTREALQLHSQGHYKEAAATGRRAVDSAVAQFGAAHPRTALAMKNLAEIQRSLGNYAEGELLAKRALQIVESVGGPDHPALLNFLNTLALLNWNQSKNSEAELLFQRALKVGEKELGPEHPDIVLVVANLAAVYYDQARFTEAEKSFQRVLAIREKAFGPVHEVVANSLNNLAVLYMDMARYSEAEALQQRALDIRQKLLGPDHPAVGQAVQNLAELYRKQGKYDKAVPLYGRALTLYEKGIGPEHVEVGNTYNNLGLLYYYQKKYAEAEQPLLKALAIKQKALGPDHPSVAITLSNLALVYTFQSKLLLAESFWRRSLEISEKALGADHVQVAPKLHNLAALYWIRSKYAEADPLLRRALSIRQKGLFPEHPDVGNSLESLAINDFARDMPEEADKLFDAALHNIVQQFRYHFTYMSEKERLSFLEGVSGLFPIYFSFCTTYRDQNPALIGKFYDVILAQKGFVAGSIAALRKKIEASGDQEAIELLDQLTDRKSQISKLLTTQPPDRVQWKNKLDQLQQEAEALEQQLVKRSTYLAEEKRQATTTWQDVRKALKPGEAAVEFVRFRAHKGKDWTNTTYYVALIVTPETVTNPIFVLLGEEEKLEGAPIDQYRQHTGNRGLGAERAKTLHEALWKPIKLAAPQAKKIYVSPDGILNQVSLGLIPGEDGRLLIEQYDIRIVSSTRDVLRIKKSSSEKSAVLVGNPDFALDAARHEAALQELRRSKSSGSAGKVDATPLSENVRGLILSKRRSLPPLPGTKIEVGTIEGLLKKQGWKSEVYTDALALEETIKGVKHPRVLHLATHGFFLPDAEKARQLFASDLPANYDDPMLRSGLVFAGVDRALSGESSSTRADEGVLTAYEAMELNLQGTELVVLSACETGLGTVKNGEGVFGLRRAFQVAGAETILMSLWSIPDRETQELMALFYEKWLMLGKDKHEALREAQLEMRERVKTRYGKDLPFYWGAFIRVG
ncbi:MAG TPA: CHAT domain-containing tetratricopeptide repeat protein [Pyrinomonadaceae bacterium]|nr:CHAT domain-containing tetratricopeptide repeat protein [Pyrinomonadaceae bacterium]